MAHVQEILDSTDQLKLQQRNQKQLTQEMKTILVYKSNQTEGEILSKVVFNFQSDISDINSYIYATKFYYKKLTPLFPLYFLPFF